MKKKLPLFFILLLSLFFFVVALGFSVALSFFFLKSEKENPNLLDFKKVNETKIVGVKILSPTSIRFFTNKKTTPQEQELFTRYFLTAITLPEDDLWVNLNLNENGKIAPFYLGITELGKTMLEQDFILKKSLASLSYPYTRCGSRFWQIVHYLKYPHQKKGFKFRNWIVPDKVVIVDNDMSMFIKKADLNVFCEAMDEPSQEIEKAYKDTLGNQASLLVSFDENFYPIRQAYRAVICGIWFKNKFKNTFYDSQINRKKTAGNELQDKEFKNKVWKDFENNFNKGVWKIEERQCGGILFKYPSSWIEVQQKGLEETKIFFDIIITPSKENRTKGIDNISTRQIGGIRLNATIEVQEKNLGLPEEDIKNFFDSEGLDFKIVKQQ